MAQLLSDENMSYRFMLNDEEAETYGDITECLVSVTPSNDLDITVWYPPNAKSKQGSHLALIFTRLMRERASLIAKEADLRQKVIKSHEEICQMLGQALGYPRYKDDQKNFPGSTEADGVCVGDEVAETLAQQAAERIRGLETEVKGEKSQIGRTS